MAISETQLIIEIKGWFEGIGGNIEVLEKPKLETNRSTNILILKNFQNNSTLPQFEELFERFGEVQIFLSPNNIVGIAQYTTDTSGNTAMQKLQGKYINGWPLYLEFAPAQLFPQGVHRHKNVKSKKSQNIIGIYIYILLLLLLLLLLLYIYIYNYVIIYIRRKSGGNGDKR